jgi:uncharacterized membrane protein
MTAIEEVEGLPAEEELESEEETLEKGLPFEEYGKDSERLREQIERCEKQYDEREKVIGQIMEFGTGIESEKALRMYPTSVLRKWAKSLENYRSSQIAEQTAASGQKRFWGNPVTERMLVVVFDDESKAYEGAKALNQLDREGSVSVHAGAVVKKNLDGTVTVEDGGSDFPIRTVGGTAIGSLIGLLGGPIGLGIGAATGALVGYVADLNRLGVNADYFSDVSSKLTPGKWALVSDVSEEWQTPVDSRMEALGGTVFRATREDVEDQQYARDVSTLNSEIAQLKKEEAQAREEDKKRIRGKIDSLNYKLHQRVQQARDQRDREMKEAQAKINALEEKAKQARGDAKATIEARIDSLKKKFPQPPSKGETAPQQQMQAA